jgi:hypothetical protein
MKLTFGKHKGCSIQDIPRSYLEWGVDRLESSKWREEFQKELFRRRDEEKKEIAWIKENLDNPESMEKLTNKFIGELTQEITQSGCEWEYENFDVFKEAEELASKRINSLRLEVEIENLKSSYQSLLEFDSEKMSKMEELFYSLKLSRKNFKDPAKYSIAMEYLHKLDEKKTIQTELFLDDLLNR